MYVSYLKEAVTMSIEEPSITSRYHLQQDFLVSFLARYVLGERKGSFVSPRCHLPVLSLSIPARLYG